MKSDRGGMSQSHKSQSPKSQSPKSQSPESQSPESQSHKQNKLAVSKSQSHKSQFPKSQSHESQSPESQSHKQNKLAVSEAQFTDKQIKQVDQIRKEKNLSFDDAVSALSDQEPEKYARSLAKENSVAYLDLTSFTPDPEVLKMVAPAFCRKHVLIPISKVGKRSIVVAFSNPSDLSVKDDLANVTQMNIQTVVASEVKIMAAIQESYQPKSTTSTNTKNDGAVLEKKLRKKAKKESVENLSIVDAVNVDEAAQTDDVIKYVNLILVTAIEIKASDIHIEVYEKAARVRFRIDGKLKEMFDPPQSQLNAICSRIKILSKLNIAEKRRPQDGRLKVCRSSGKEVDFRVSVIPVLFGEKIVMRLLDQTNLIADLEELHLSDREVSLIRDNISKPQGMVLMTGPTGSGKTTTIYSILAEINTEEINISTAEDPVEYNVKGINQVQVNAEIGFDFSGALRSFLRQDPEVIMVGEIRDRETAEISFKAASTGHLVVSTLHTNDSVSTVTRLVDIGIPGYVVSEVLSIVIAQRLVRKNCVSCTQPNDVKDQVLLDLGVKKEHLPEFQNLKKGEGCDKCNDSGYKGRMPIFEILEMTPALRKAIINGDTNARLKDIAIKNGLITLRGSALNRLKEGFTTVEEVINTSISDEEIDE